MDTDLKRFCFQNPCPKCGKTEAETTWEEDLPLTGQSNGPNLIMDLLRRSCQRCGYEWHELPLDAEKGDTA